MNARMPTRTWHLDDIKAFARVDCCGEKHVIILDKRGRLHFCDHPRGYCSTVYKMRLETGLAPEKGCQEVLHNWRRQQRWVAPHDLQDPVGENAKLQSDRAQKKILNVDPWSTRTPLKLRTELINRCKRAAQVSAMKATAYRRSPSASVYQEAHEVVIEFTADGVLRASSTMIKKNVKGRSRNVSVFTFVVRPNWLTRVQKRGIARVERHFVLDVLEEMPSGRIRALVVRQGPGLNLLVDEAILTKVDDKWTLAWGRARKRNVAIARMPAASTAA